MCGVWAITALILSFAVVVWLVAVLLHVINQRQSSTVRRISDSLDRTVDNCIDFNSQVRLLGSERDAAQACMFLFFNLDSSGRLRFIYNASRCSVNINNVVRIYFVPLYTILSSDDDYNGGYHFAHYDDDQKKMLSEIRNSFEKHMSRPPLIDYLDVIMRELCRCALKI